MLNQRSRSNNKVSYVKESLYIISETSRFGGGPNIVRAEQDTGTMEKGIDLKFRFGLRADWTIGSASRDHCCLRARWRALRASAAACQALPMTVSNS